MGTTEADVNQGSRRVLAPRQAGPTSARLLVGCQLRQLREAANITREDAGEAIRASGSKISRLELGRTGFKSRDLSDLLDLYGVRDDERATLLTLARQANAPGWWRAYRDVVAPWSEHYLGLEQAASVIRTYDVQLMPGLLRTADYARAVLRLSPRKTLDAQIERQIELLAHRQRLALHRPDPPRVWAVIDEAALRRPVGGTATMRAQIGHLIQTAESSRVTVQVMPFSVGGHAAAGGAITMLRFPGEQLHDVVYLEQLSTAVYLAKPAETSHYWDVLNCVVSEAKSPSETIDVLRQILSET